MENFKIYLLQGKYIKAEEICKNIDNNSIKDMIMNIAYETENICVYSFTQYMIQRTKKNILDRIGNRPNVTSILPINTNI